MKKIKILSSIVLTTILATSAVLAWTDLWTVSDSDTLTATLWNTVIWKINENGKKLEGVYNVWGNIWIWETSPIEKLDINWKIRVNEWTDSVTIDVAILESLIKNIEKKCTRWDTYNWTTGVYFFSHPSISSSYTNCEKVYLTDIGHLIYPVRWWIDIAQQVNDWLWTADYIRTNFLYLWACSSSTSILCNESYLSNSYIYSQNSVHENFAAWTYPKYSWGSISRCACDL
jgi:hypothetical protein